MKGFHKSTEYLRCLFVLVSLGCKKDAVTAEEKSIISVKVFDNNSIRFPIQVVACKGTLVSAYYTWDNINRSI